MYVPLGEVKICHIVMPLGYIKGESFSGNAFISYINFLGKKKNEEIEIMRSAMVGLVKHIFLMNVCERLMNIKARNGARQ